MFFVAYAFKGQVASACVCRASENCKSLVLQDKCSIEVFLFPAQKVIAYVSMYSTIFVLIMFLYIGLNYFPDYTQR